MTIITFGGEVKLIKLPQIINPMRDDEPAQPPPAQAPAGKGQPAAQAQNLAQSPSTSQLEDKFNLKSDIDSIPVSNLDLTQLLIVKLEARKELKFKDPFLFKQYPEGASEEQIAQIDAQNSTIPVYLPHNQPAQTFKYTLGSLADR